MGVLGRLVLLPLAPLAGVLWLATVLERIAAEELDDPARWRAVLEEAEAAHARGELDDDDLAAVQDEIVGRLIGDGGLEDMRGGVTLDG